MLGQANQSLNTEFSSKQRNQGAEGAKFMALRKWRMKLRD
jgi:hypothetical protein